MAGATGVAGVATIVVILLPTHLEWEGARFAVAACIGIITYAEIRALGGTRARAVWVAAVALVLAGTVAALTSATVSAWSGGLLCLVGLAALAAAMPQALRYRAGSHATRDSAEG